jgi:ParB-like nuclease domain
MTRRSIDIGGREMVAADPGPAPMLQWIGLDRLVIDDRYQRALAKGNWKSIETIAANFQWSRFGPVLVAPVEGGMFAVIDGQHRAHAAALCGLAEVPAMVVQVGTEEQSKAFAWINSQAVRVTVFHVFKAAIAAREDWAVRAEAAVAGAGCRLMTYNTTGAQKQARQVFCIGFIRKQIEAGNDWAVTLGCKSVAACPSLGDRPVSYTDYLLRPWIMAVIYSGCRDLSVLVRALSASNPFKVIERPGLSGGRTGLRSLIRQAEMAT